MLASCIYYIAHVNITLVCCLVLHSAVMGVDLFFNVPKHSPVQYTYHTVTIPAMYHIFPDPTQTIQQVVCDADFHGQLKIFLNSGWKLVDICFDSTSIADGQSKSNLVSRHKSSIRIRLSNLNYQLD